MHIPSNVYLTLNFFKTDGESHAYTISNECTKLKNISWLITVNKWLIFNVSFKYKYQSTLVWTINAKCT